MPRRINPKRPAAKPSGKALSFPDWKAAAVKFMSGRAGTMPEREWKRAFISGMPPDDAEFECGRRGSNARPLAGFAFVPSTEAGRSVLQPVA
jgi:hypothetical protein